MDRRVFLWCVLIVLAVIVIGKQFGPIGEKMTPVKAAAEPLVPQMAVGRWVPDPGYLGPDFFDSDRLNRNSGAALDEMEGVVYKARDMGDERTMEICRPLNERLIASLKRIESGNYDPLKEDQEISDIRRELRKMGLVKQ